MLTRRSLIAASPAVFVTSRALTMEELFDRCGPGLRAVVYDPGEIYKRPGWYAIAETDTAYGGDETPSATPQEAVYKLWVHLGRP